MHLQVRGAPCLFDETIACYSPQESQCTYRCVVLPAGGGAVSGSSPAAVSMHLQVRGAPCPVS